MDRPLGIPHDALDIAQDPGYIPRRANRDDIVSHSWDICRCWPHATADRLNVRENAPGPLRTPGDAGSRTPPEKRTSHPGGQ